MTQTNIEKLNTLGKELEKNTVTSTAALETATDDLSAAQEALSKAQAALNMAEKKSLSDRAKLAIFNQDADKREKFILGSNYELLNAHFTQTNEKKINTIGYFSGLLVFSTLLIYGGIVANPVLMISTLLLGSTPCFANPLKTLHRDTAKFTHNGKKVIASYRDYSLLKTHTNLTKKAKRAFAHSSDSRAIVCEALNKELASHNPRQPRLLSEVKAEKKAVKATRNTMQASA